ncbi:MAG: hypothetical protein AAFO69_01860 [Bacteroidota bacterium]
MIHKEYITTMRFSVILSLLLCSHMLQGQTYIIKEDFENNMNEWPFIQSYETSDATIENGQLTWVNKNENQYQSTYLFSNEDWNKNFRITARMKITDGNRQYCSGILFSSSKNRGSYYRFGFSDTGYWQFVEMTDSKVARDETGWQKSDVVKIGDFNDIEIRKLGEYFFFSLNGVLLHYEKGLKKKDSYLAINFPNGATSVVDYIYSEETTETDKEEKQLQEQYFMTIAKERVLIDEQFNDNSREWPYLEGSDLGEGSFANGVLTYRNKSQNYIQSSRNIPLNWALDFTITAKIKRQSGRIDNIYGVMYSFKDWNNYYYFGFAPNGYWKMRKVKNEKEAYTSGWKKTEIVKEDQFNDVKIMKIGNKMLYFLNEELVYNRQENERLGNNIGMVICDSAVAVYDQLKVTQQYRTAEEQEKLLKKYLPKSESASKAAGKVEKIGDKKHQKHKYRLNESWRGTPIAALKTKWGNPYKISGGSTAGRYYYRYKIVNGKQYYYQINYVSNGGKYGPVVSEIYFTSSPY